MLTNSSASPYCGNSPGTLPTMPPSSRLVIGMSSSTCLRSPPKSEVTRPNQLACMPSSRLSLGRMAGVHSSVWMRAISPTLISRAVWKSASSSQSGYFSASMSAIALCSLTNTVLNMPRPSHQLRMKPVRSAPVSSSTGSSPSSVSSIRPPSWERSECWVSQSLP